MPTEWDSYIHFIRDIGFPIAVATFVLWRLEQRLKEVVEALGAVNVTLATLVEQGRDLMRFRGGEY